jgi:hypothetical protein
MLSWRPYEKSFVYNGNRRVRRKGGNEEKENKEASCKEMKKAL